MDLMWWIVIGMVAGLLGKLVIPREDGDVTSLIEREAPNGGAQ